MLAAALDAVEKRGFARTSDTAFALLCVAYFDGMYSSYPVKASC